MDIKALQNVSSETLDLGLAAIETRIETLVSCGENEKALDLLRLYWVLGGPCCDLDFGLVVSA
jgi:hypothetical protein